MIDHNMNTTGLLFDIKRFAVHDGPGIRTTLFLKGCGLKCRWCHNPEGISRQPQLAYYAHKCINCGECVLACGQSAHQMLNERHIFCRDKCIACGKCESVCLGQALKYYGRQITVEEAVAIISEDRIFYDQTGGGATLSGGEPLMQSQFCYELLSALKKQCIHTAVDTCGFVKWADFEKVLPVTDMFLYDVKHIDDKIHIANVGGSNKVILENLQKLSNCGIPIEIRIPIIPGFNLDEESLKAFGSKLGCLSNITSVRLLPYHDLARSKYEALNMPDTMPQVEPPAIEQIDAAANILKKFGLNIK